MHSWHRPKLVLTISSSLPSFRVFWQLSWWRRTRHGHSWSFVDLFRLNWGIDFWAAFSLIICKMTFISRSSFKKHYIMTVSLVFWQKLLHGTWKWWFPKGISYSRVPFSGSMLNFGRVNGSNQHLSCQTAVSGLGEWFKQSLPGWATDTDRQLSVGKALRTQVFAVVKPPVQWSL